MMSRSTREREDVAENGRWSKNSTYSQNSYVAIKLREKEKFQTQEKKAFQSNREYSNQNIPTYYENNKFNFVEPNSHYNNYSSTRSRRNELYNTNCNNNYNNMNSSFASNSTNAISFLNQNGKILLLNIIFFRRKPAT
jgi:hypothetical protein